MVVRDKTQLKEDIQGSIYRGNVSKWIAGGSWLLALVIFGFCLIYGFRNPPTVQLQATQTSPSQPSPTQSGTDKSSNDEQIRRKKESILICWALAIPVWFAVEHWFIFRRFGKAGAFDQFKHQQELISRIWLAAVAVLAALYFGFPGK